MMPETPPGSVDLLPGTVELLKVHECAEAIRVSVQTVRKWIRTGTLPAVRIGGTIRVRRRDLEQLLAATTTID
jgi:excisionase family DNA binding protein